jgi:hypothetical protein
MVGTRDDHELVVPDDAAAQPARRAVGKVPISTDLT